MKWKERFEWLDAILRADISMATKVVGVYLWNRADDDRKCYPSVGTIAKACRLVPRTVQQSTRTLAAAGFIDIARPRGRARQELLKKTTSDKLPNIYTLTTPSGAHIDSPRGAHAGAPRIAYKEQPTTTAARKP